MKPQDPKNPGGTVNSSDYNSFVQEGINMVEAAQITLDVGNQFQLAEANANYSTVGNYYQDVGAANAYVVNAVAPRKGITSYINGSRIRYVPANSNTGASTINVEGRGNVSLLDSEGLVLTGGEIQAGTEIKVQYDGTAFRLVNGISGNLFNSVDNLQMSSNGAAPTTTWDFTVGKCVDNSKSFIIVNDTPAFSKNLALTWVPGLGNGGRATGSPLASFGLYFSFALSKPDGTFDIGYDHNPQGNNLFPEVALDGYTKARRIGAFFTGDSFALRPMQQTGDFFIFHGPSVAIADHFQVGLIATLDYVFDIATPALYGCQTYIEYYFTCEGSGVFNINLFNPNQDNLQPYSGGTNGVPIGIGSAIPARDQRGRTWINTDSASQLQYRTETTDPSSLIAITSLGWYDPRLA